MLLGDTKLMGCVFLPKNKLEEKLKKCKCLQDLKKLHNEYMSQDRNYLKSDYLNELLPYPPISDTENIKCIRLKSELVLEGGLMNHCVASYHSEIVKGHYFVYRILNPERGTVGLRFKNGKWVIDQIKLLNNRAASEETVKAVNLWIKLTLIHILNAISFKQLINRQLFIKIAQQVVYHLVFFEGEC